MGGSRKKLLGHYCWCCDRRRPNERFSGRGHRQHICKECMTLGGEELAFRQHVRNIDRMLTWDGMILRKQRATFERYVSHPDARVREYANQVKDHNEQRRKELREVREADRLEEERNDEFLDQLACEAEIPEGDVGESPDDRAEIPFRWWARHRTRIDTSTDEHCTMGAKET